MAEYQTQDAAPARELPTMQTEPPRELKERGRAVPKLRAPVIESTERTYRQQTKRIVHQALEVRTAVKEKLLKHAKTIACELYHRTGMELPRSLQAFYVDQVVYGQIYPRAHWDYLPRNYSGHAVYFKSEDIRERVDEWEKVDDCRNAGFWHIGGSFQHARRAPRITLGRSIEAMPS